jgi:hypothetical protein
MRFTSFVFGLSSICGGGIAEFLVSAIITATPGNWFVNVSVSPSNTSATVQLNLVRIDSVSIENRFINFFSIVGDA